MATSEIDEIYDTADLLMKAGRWSVIDDLLMYYGMAAWRMDLDLLITWAVVTNACRSKLKNRESFIERCLEFHDDPEDPQLWKGLT